MLGPDDGEQGQQRTELSPEVRGSVEEYLRKFFGGSLRIRHLLDEDMRSFVSSQLRGFIEWREMAGEEAERLVEMTSQGLKGNPRRIKQFVNNLQLRLQMLAERRVQGRIQIDPDVRVVAKLAIIEEEFPDQFRDLENDPALLARWHAQASAAEGTVEAAENDLPMKLISFLRFTDDIQPNDIRAYLNLKQTKREIELPRHSEFVELLDGGEVERLNSLLTEEPDKEAAYTDSARWHFDKQRKAEAWNRAHNTLRAIVEVPMLHGKDGGVVKIVLKDALSEPNLASRLGNLDPNKLLMVVDQHKLPTEIADGVVKQLVLAIGNQQSEARRRISVALAGHARMVSDLRRGQIAAILGKDDVRGDFDSYASLVIEMPEVVRDQVLDAALARIEEVGADGVSMASGAFQVTLAALRSRPDDERLDRLLRLARPALGAYRDTHLEGLGSVADELARTIAVGGSPTSSMPELASWLVSDWDAVPPESRKQVVDLCLALCRRSPDAAAAAGAALAERMFELEDGTEIMHLLAHDFDSLPEQIRARAQALTSEALAGARPSLAESRADDLLALFPPEVRAGMVRDALALATAAEQDETTRRLFAQLSESEQGKMITVALSRAEGAPVDRMADVRFIVVQQTHIDEDRLFQFAMSVAQTIFSNRNGVVQLAPRLGEIKLADAERRRHLVEHMVNTEKDMSDENNREAMLRAACNVAGKRPSKAKNAITSRLQEIQSREGGRMATLAGELLSETGQ